MTDQPRLFPEGRPRKSPKPAKAGPLKSCERSLRWLRARGYVAERCETWVPQPLKDAAFTGGFRKDLFGFADILAFSPDRPGVVAVQCTSRQQVSAHVNLYRKPGKARDALRAWLSQPNRTFLVLGWAPVAIANRTTAGSRVRWTVEQRWVSLTDLE